MELECTCAEVFSNSDVEGLIVISILFNIIT